MNRIVSLSGFVAACLVLGFGCASADDIAPADDAPISDDVGNDSVESQGDIGSIEQAITMPVEPGGPAQQCASACSRTSATNITGMCCVCNGSVKKFSRSPTIATLYLCK